MSLPPVCFREICEMDTFLEVTWGLPLTFPPKGHKILGTENLLHFK